VEDFEMNRQLLDFLSIKGIWHFEGQILSGSVPFLDLAWLLYNSVRKLLAIHIILIHKNANES
jgi:hypothetical protein